MPSHSVTRGLPPEGMPMLSGDEVAAILETAYQIISTLGIAVPNSAHRQRIVGVWGAEQGERVTFRRDEVDAYLRRWRERNGLGEPGWQGAVPWPYHSATRLPLSVMPYSHTYLDPATGQHLALTTDRLVAATRFLGTFYGQGVDATVPGHPGDVPAPLQPLMEYKLGAQYNPAGGGYGWLGAPATAEYLFRMAEVMGQPITATVVYVTSPLRLGGVELETAIAHRDRLSTVHVGNMGSCGASLPLAAPAALALAWAETIAGAMCIEALTGLPTTWSGSIEPFDMRAATIPFGAPEQVLLYRFAREARAWLCGQPSSGGHVSLLTMAKHPGAQSLAEKALAGALGLAAGATGLGAGGSLSADEVFSPAQLILDCELRDWLSRAAQGLPRWHGDLTDAIATIREGLEAGTYAATQDTLRHYRDCFWFPTHFRREMLAAWRSRGSPDPITTANHEALQRLEAATWVLPEPRFSQLEAIYDEARRKLV